MKIVETFYVDRPREVVFDYATNPAHLGEWQTSNRSVEQLGDGPPGPGTRFRERTKPPGRREFVQITEFAELVRPALLRVRVVDGPQLIDGAWRFEPEGERTRVTFVAEGQLRGLLRFLTPIVRRLIARQFATYHRNLRRNLEAD